MSGKLRRVARAFTSTPWAILPDKLLVMRDVLDRHVRGEHLTRAEIRAAIGGTQPRRQATAQSVAVLPVFGVISHRMNVMSEYSGGTSTEQLGASIDRLLDDSTITALVLDVDSPGGSVEGLPELVAKIEAAKARTGKPVYAVANALAASAAYWIAAAADELYATPSAQVGSIGVFCCHEDWSQAEAEAGLKTTLVSAGRYKVEGNPHEPLSDEARAALQNKVDEFYALFVEDVARLRGESTETVVNGYGEGRTLPARQALAEGMIDGILSLDELLADLTAERRAPGLAASVRRVPIAAGATVQDVAALLTLGGRLDVNEPHSPDRAQAAAQRVRRILAAAGRPLRAEGEDEPDPELVCPECGGAMDNGECAECGYRKSEARGSVPASTQAPASSAPKARGDTMPDNGTAARPGADTPDPAALTAENARLRVLSAMPGTYPEFFAEKPNQLSAWITDGTAVERANADISAFYRARANANHVPTRTPQVSGGRPAAEDDPRRGFRTQREFLRAVIENAGLRDRSQVTDERLKPLAVMDKEDARAAGELAFVMPRGFTPGSLLRAAVGSDEHGEYSDTYGGFSLVAQRLAPRDLIGFDGDPSAGRTEPIPMQAPVVEIEAATDKDHTTSVAAGLTVARKAETAAGTASRQAREMITLKAASLFGLSYFTEELLADSPDSFIARIENGFDAAFSAKIFDEKLRGIGGSEYLGALNSPALVSIAKETGQAADTINYLNVLKMRARCWGYDNAIWIANHDCYPQLAVLAIPVGVGGTAVYQQSMVEGRPDMLLGRPIFYSEFASTIGDQGDLILWNPSTYMEGLYQPIQSAESVHVRFVNHERAVKFWLRNAGAPSWRAALTPKKGANTLSPMIVLDAR